MQESHSKLLELYTKISDTTVVTSQLRSTTNMVTTILTEDADSYPAFADRGPKESPRNPYSARRNKDTEAGANADSNIVAGATGAAGIRKKRQSKTVGAVELPTSMSLANITGEPKTEKDIERAVDSVMSKAIFGMSSSTPLPSIPGIMKHFKKVGTNMYQVGGQKVNLTYKDNQVLVRVGGGFTPFQDWATKNASKLRRFCGPTDTPTPDEVMDEPAQAKAIAVSEIVALKREQDPSAGGEVDEDASEEHSKLAVEKARIMQSHKSELALMSSALDQEKVRQKQLMETRILAKKKAGRRSVNLAETGKTDEVMGMISSRTGTLKAELESAKVRIAELESIISVSDIQAKCVSLQKEVEELKEQLAASEKRKMTPDQLRAALRTS